MKAIPTEYKGVRFRSKSEAVFARYLDRLLDELNLRNTPDPESPRVVRHAGAGFEYEPKTLIPGWCPDFLVWQCYPPMAHDKYVLWNMPSLTFEFIEYKPSRPTDTYLDNWRKKYSEWQRLAVQGAVNSAARTSANIYYGSPFSSASRGVINMDAYDCCDTDKDYDWVCHYHDLLDYRFDLQTELVNG